MRNTRPATYSARWSCATPSIAAGPGAVSVLGGSVTGGGRALSRTRASKPVYIAAWPGLTPRALLRSAAGDPVGFPLNALHRTYFYRARNAIYHLIRALRLQQGETILVPSYHHGNEVRAIRAAGATIRFYSIRRDLQPDLDALARLCRSSDIRAL